MAEKKWPFRVLDPKRVARPEHRHAEAYRLMAYADNTGKVEWLWNSRDGVTPFGIDGFNDGAIHVHWYLDVYAPFFVPPIGMRIFVDLTAERALEHATRRVDNGWDDPDRPMKDHPVLGALGRDGAALYLAQEMMEQPGQPDIVVVDEALHARFAARARDMRLDD